MVTRRERDLFLVVNASCKEADTATSRAHRPPLPDRAAARSRAARAAGPEGRAVLARLAPGARAPHVHDRRRFALRGSECFVTRSGYTGEDGFEISVPADSAEALARALLARRR